MEPRVFISSTFYDLKYVREELGGFVSKYGFQPLRFEAGDIGYEYGEELDKSCYKAMQHSDLAILIIGGRYGSPASEDKDKLEKFEDYISVTKQEFNTAVNSNIPVFVFVEDGVLSEYRIYQKNREKFNKTADLVEFVAADNINIFKFIDSIYNLSTYAVTSFKTVDEIKMHLTKQWANMFWEYLRILKEKKEKDHLSPEINNIYLVVQSMQKMIQSIGQSVIDDEDKYKNILNEQMIETAANKIADTYSFISSTEDAALLKQYFMFFVSQLVKTFDDGCIDYYFSANDEDITEFFKRFEYDGILLVEVKNRLKYDSETFELLRRNQEDIVERLLQTDYLKKMGFI